MGKLILLVEKPKIEWCLSVTRHQSQIQRKERTLVVLRCLALQEPQQAHLGFPKPEQGIATTIADSRSSMWGMQCGTQYISSVL